MVLAEAGASDVLTIRARKESDNMADLTEPFFFTWSAQKGAQGLSLTGGQGAHFTTADGARWLDLGSLVFQANLGHGRTDIVEAIKAQADKLALSIPSMVTEEKRQLAQKLLAHAPAGFDRVFFTLGGSDAIENAIKISRMVTGCYKLISRYRSYHGATMGAVSLSGDYRRPPVEPGLPGVIHVPDFDDMQGRVERGEPASLIPRTIELEGNSVAAVFVEPVVGANGVLIPPKGYLPSLREACDRAGALLVIDEVLTGFGRTGKWFALEHDPVVPDMITIGKALTAGYGTLGAVLVHERISRHFDESKLYAGLTHYAHPLGVAAALASVLAYENEHLIERALKLESVFAEGLQQIAASAGKLAVEARARGLLGAVEMRLGEDGWNKLRGKLAQGRIHAHPRPHVDALMFSPPLCITEAELSQGLSKVATFVAEVAS